MTADYDTVTLQCSKTGREYVAKIEDRDPITVINAWCPYCECRGKEALIDDIRQKIEDIESEGETAHEQVYEES